MKRVSVLCVVAVLMASAVAYGQTPPVDRLPEGVVAVIESPNLTLLEQGLAGFVQQVSPETLVPPIGMMLVAQALKTGDPLSVDMQQPFRVVVLAPPRHTSPVLVCSVPDAGRYLSSLEGTMLQKQADEGNVHIYADGGQQFVVGTAGTQVAVSNDVEAVKTVVGLIEGGSLPAGPLFEDCDLGAAVRVKKLLDALDAMGQNPFEQVRQNLPSPDSMAPGVGMNAQQGMKMLKAELDAAEAIAGQVDALNLAIALKPDAIVVTSYMRPVAGSGLANYVASVPEGDLELLRYVPADSVAVVGLKIGDLGPFMNWYAGFMEATMPTAGEGTPMPAFVDLMRKSASLMGHELALGFAIGEQGHLRVVEAAAITDPAAMQEFVQQAVQQMPGLMARYEQMGMKMSFNVTPNALSYGGHDLTELDFGIQFVPVAGMPGGEQMAAMQQKMIELMYGPEMKGYWTYLDGNLVYVQGDGALDCLKQVIDGAIRPAAGSDRLAEATMGMPSGPRSVAYFSLSDFANWMVKVVQAVVAQQAGQVPPQLAAMKFDAGPAIGGASWVADGVVRKQCRIPVAAVRPIVAGIQKAVATPAPVPAPAAVEQTP